MHHVHRELERVQLSLFDSLLPDPESVTVNNKLDLDLLVKQVTDAIKTADIKTIPRNKYRSLSKKLPPHIRTLLRVKRKLVKEVCKTSENINKND